MLTSKNIRPQVLTDYNLLEKQLLQILSKFTLGLCKEVKPTTQINGYTRAR